jgi:TM2 domain-containing membrane protein YozV
LVVARFIRSVQVCLQSMQKIQTVFIVHPKLCKYLAHSENTCLQKTNQKSVKFGQPGLLNLIQQQGYSYKLCFFNGSSSMSDKKILPAFLLCFFLGVFSAHRFYVGKIGTAILQIITLGGLGIWLLIDFIMIIVGSFTDKNGNKITQWT